MARRDQSQVLKGRAGSLHPVSISQELFQVLAQPFQVGVVVFEANQFPHHGSNGIEALIREVEPDQVSQLGAVAAVEEERELLNDSTHVAE